MSLSVKPTTTVILSGRFSGPVQAAEAKAAAEACRAAKITHVETPDGYILVDVWAAGFEPFLKPRADP